MKHRHGRLRETMLIGVGLCVSAALVHWARTAWMTPPAAHRGFAAALATCLALGTLTCSLTRLIAMSWPQSSDCRDGSGEQ